MDIENMFSNEIYNTYIVEKYKISVSQTVYQNKPRIKFKPYITLPPTCILLNKILS